MKEAFFHTGVRERNTVDNGARAAVILGLGVLGVAGGDCRLNIDSTQTHKPL